MLCHACVLMHCLSLVVAGIAILKTTTCPRCRGEPFRISTQHSRKYARHHNIRIFVLFVCGFTVRSSPILFSPLFTTSYFLRLILSGNPLDCVCENLWIKMRILEDADSQDLMCKDDKDTLQAFITLMPPDCGNVRPCHNKQHSVSIFNRKTKKKKNCKKQDSQTGARLRSVD